MATKKQQSTNITVVEFPQAEQENPKYKNPQQRAYYELFRETKYQEQITQKVSRDIGGIFQLLALPQDLETELIGIGTLSFFQTDRRFKRNYAEKLAEALDYLDAADRSRNA